MCEGIESKSSRYADEGTAAHELAAHCLNTGRDAAKYIGWSIDIKADARSRFVQGQHPGFFEVTDEMAEGVQLYIDYVRKIMETDNDREVDVEFRFDLQHVHTGMFGTGDVVIYLPNTGRLYVCDFKYGRGVPVEPAENPQLLSYGLGAVRRHHNRPLSSVTLTVVQPRCRHPKGPVREWDTDAVTLLDFEHDLRAAALATEQPDAPLKAGDWCKFCPAAATCPALRDRAKDIAKAEFGLKDPEGMEPAQIATVLADIGILKDWCKRFEEYAHDQVAAGHRIPGYKLVEKRAIRKWKDESSIAAVLADIYELDATVIYKPAEVNSPAQIERLMPGKNKEQRAKVLEPLTVKNSSGAVLVPEHDIRPSVKTDVTQEFGHG
jgi:hypothetical protein